MDLHLSVLTIGEIRKGIERLRDRDPAQAEVFTSWLDELLTRFSERIVPIDARIAEESGRLNAAEIRNTVDSLIAATATATATACAHGLTVVTRNTTDFEGCDVPLLNPGITSPMAPQLRASRPNRDSNVDARRMKSRRRSRNRSGSLAAPMNWTVSGGRTP